MKTRTEIQDNIIATVKPTESGRLILAPRVGKSRIAIEILKRDRPQSVLWVTPFKDLAKKNIPAEFDKWNFSEGKLILSTVTWKSLHKTKGCYDIIILDEEQYITRNNAVTLLNGALRYKRILTLTGTKSDKYKKEVIFKLLNLPILYHISVLEANTLKLTADYILNVVSIDMLTDKIIEAGNKKNRFMTTERANYEYLSDVINRGKASRDKNLKFKILNRMRAIHNSPSKLALIRYLLEILANDRKLVFTPSQKIAGFLSTDVYHSKTTDKALLEFKDKKINTLFLVQKGGIGENFTDLKHLIIMQSDSNSQGLTVQKIHRTLLKQEESYKAQIWLMYLKDTQDEFWVKKTLRHFKSSKVQHYNFNPNSFILFKL